MYTEANLYSGFFLERLPGTHNGKHLIKVACFQAGTDFRKVHELTTDQQCDHQYGTIVHFWSIEGYVEERSLIEFREKPENQFIRQDTLPEKIVYTAKGMAVGKENLRSLGVYRHTLLGKIVYIGPCMTPGKYNSITFEVIFNDDTFELKLLGWQLLEETPEPRKTETAEEKFEWLSAIEHEDSENGEKTNLAPVNQAPVTAFREQNQSKNILFQEPLREENFDDLNMQDILENHATIPQELQKINDGKAVKRGLNQRQWAALKMALNEERKLICIQGAPGTGKTHLLSILLIKLIKDNKQAIVLTPTNVALKIIKAMTERQLLERKISHSENALMDSQTYNKFLNDLGEADKELALKERMKDVRVVFSTIAPNFINDAMRTKTFEPCMCIIDEVTQLLGVHTFPAVLGTKRIIMAGDPKGLEAFIPSNVAEDLANCHSVMDWITANKEFYSWIMLEDQHRCHKDIIQWSKRFFYGKNLTTFVDDRTIHQFFDSQPPREFLMLYDPFVMVDTSLQHDEVLRKKTYEKIVFDEENCPNSDYSYINFGEADIAMEHYKRLISYEIPAKNIAILTPYHAQAQLLNEKMEEFSREPNYEKCKSTMIATIYNAQGQEYDAVIFSMVRSNPRREMGYISNLNRLNVAITRAKWHFLLICNGFMLAESDIHQIKSIFNITKESHRFHPNHVSGGKGVVTDKVTNNFGLYLQDFMDYSNDTKMKTWCRKWVRIGQSPEYKNQKAEKELENLQLEGSGNSKKVYKKR